MKNDLSGRIEWIDFVRGFGMLLVIAGHSGIPNPYWKIIYMFHMPLFFMITGAVYDKKKDKVAFGDYFKALLSKYVKPYLVFSIGALFVTFALPIIYGIPFGYDQLGRFIFGIFVARGQSAWTGNWGAVWFLIATFVLLIIIHIINRFDSIIIKVIGCVAGPLLSILGTRVVWDLGRGWLIWNLGAALMAVPFFYIGYLYKTKLRLKEGSALRYAYPVIGIGLIILCVIIGRKNPNTVAFANNSYGNVLFMFIGAAGISLGLFFLADFVYSLIGGAKPLRILEWIGKNTLPLLGIHGMTIPVMTFLLAPIVSVHLWLAVFAATLVIDSLLIIIWNKTRALIRVSKKEEAGDERA